MNCIVGFFAWGLMVVVIIVMMMVMVMVVMLMVMVTMMIVKKLRSYRTNAGALSISQRTKIFSFLCEKDEISYDQQRGC